MRLSKPSTDPSQKVVVGMSGGVDSSVAASLLIQAGYHVIGVMMQLWSEDEKEYENRGCNPEAISMARNVSEILNIPFYTIDARQVFYNRVVQEFIDGYSKGITPNPCILCNQYIRWGFLLEKALELGAEFLATGHYARLCRTDNNKIQLLRGVDLSKDQSYVLHILTQGQLSHSLFPIGEYTKLHVRQIARDLSLPTANRTDSQDLCFLGESGYNRFLIRYAPQVLKPGPILNLEGKQIGEHRGLAFYTIGQRKGINVHSPVPLYVFSRDITQNSLVVCRGEELSKDQLIVGAVNWIAGEPPGNPFRAQVKIRYKAQETWATIKLIEKQCVAVHLDISQPGISPGQSAVFYNDEVCLGGGIIQVEEQR